MIIFKYNIITSRNKFLQLVKSMEGTNSGRKNTLPTEPNNSKHAKRLVPAAHVQDCRGCDTSYWNPIPTLQNGFIQESIRPNQGNFNATSNQFNCAPSFLKSAYEKSMQHRNYSRRANNLNGVSFNRDKSSSSSTTQQYRKTKMFEKLGSAIRVWEDVNVEDVSKDGVSFKLMSYNVLAQDLVDQHMDLYHPHDKRDLPWPKRWERLLSEIKHHKADILCLQEVQLTHLNDFYKKDLEKLGYEGIYKKRTGKCPDGCAIFYKPKVFRLVEHTTVEYFQPLSFLLDRENVGIVAKFVPVSNNNAEFIVATTHLLYNPRRSDVRVAQLQLFLTEIERMSYKESDFSEYLPIIMTGDLNSQPNSEVTNFVKNAIIDNSNLGLLHTKTSNMQDTNGWIPSRLGVTDGCQHIEIINKRLSSDVQQNIQQEKLIKLHHSDRNDNAWGNSQNIENEYFKRGFLSHLFNFKSVYEHGTENNPEGTTFQYEWITVDYIFYSVKNDGKSLKSDDKLKLLSRYTLPMRRELDNVHVPNRYVGSDHLSLLVRFKLDF